MTSNQGKGSNVDVTGAVESIEGSDKWDKNSDSLKTTCLDI